ncbi:hypothetical protein ACE7GA_24280 [Roseomonas sp. CCTCC AB2023176]|uniref:hypothetical protein n=1 Tax=Roseomonas sp. CCTCC AB2023176 TaxID=3342640 RepID=UPI0035DFFB55
MGRAMWMTVPGEALVSEVKPGLRLVVTRTEAPATVRFVVEDRVMGGMEGHPVLSGYRESVAAAMAAAEDGAARIGGG